jgi:hypothetical protein
MILTMKKTFILFIFVHLGYFTFADGFISSTFSVGYTKFIQHAESGYVFNRNGMDTLSDNLLALALDVNFVSRFGLQICFELLTGFDIGTCSQLVPAFGIGYSFDRIKNITISSDLMYSLTPFTIDNTGGYVGDGAVGLKIGVTYWLGDIGFSSIFNYYSYVLTDANIISGRIGISVKK